MAQNNRTPNVILELPGKFASDSLVYVVDLSAYLPVGRAVDHLAIEIDAGNGESPAELAVDEIEPFAEESGGIDQAVKFVLHGGTSGVRYRGAITFGNPSGSPSENARKRYFYIVVS